MKHYFENCKNLEEVKRLYKLLALENHPDRGGSTEIMQLINSQYKTALTKKFDNSDNEDFEENLKLSEDYLTALTAVAGLEGIVIELVGDWLWCTGNTYQYRDIFKKSKWIFAPKKKSWFYRAEEFKTYKNKGDLSLDEIKIKYGSTPIFQITPKKLN